jgi:hypothetical protein
MSRAAAACPNCGAPVGFTWSGSVQTVCTRCQSILVRRDQGLDLERVGQISDPPPDTSPIQLGTRGRFEGRTFEVIGRIAYEYDEGTWSEWHLLFDGGRTGWLSDAQLRYAVYEEVSPRPDLPAQENVAPGTSVTWNDTHFEVTTVTSARYRGTEGELPFTTWDRELSTFADLRGAGTAVATIDYADAEPVFFVGRSASFDELGLRNLREVDRTRTVAVGALKCQNCAAPLVIKAAGQSQSVVCGHCGSIADATDPNVAILQKVGKRPTIEPMIPLGSSGEWHGACYEVIGFQRREITVEGTDYGWHEYVLFNPQHGFRYLSEYDGHWNDIAVLDETPGGEGLGLNTRRELRGRSFRHFQSALARTVFVLGEFPWIVKVGEQVQVHDYISPPYLLSAEGTPTDSTWSLGTYVKGEALWQAFSVESQPPAAVGVFANQPSPVTHGWTYWRMFAGLAALLILAAFARFVMSGSTPPFNGSFRFDPASPNPAFVTEPFELSGRTSNVDISLDSNLSNNWMLVNLALINEETGVALDFGQALEYYFGVEAGESWSEGSRYGRVVLPSVPAGRYYLRVEPEGDAASRTQVDYSVVVRRDRPAWALYGIALVLLFIPPLAVTLRHASFEHTRWAQSDYGGGDDEDDEDEDE